MIQTNWFTEWGWIVCIVIGLLFIFAGAYKGVRNAKLMPEEFEVLSRAEMAAIGQELDKSPEKKCPEYKDRSDITEDDLDFMSHINVNQ